jgi:nucleoside transporter
MTDLSPASPFPNRTPFARLFVLSLMMFLQFAVWGVWLPIAARFMSATLEEGGLAFTDGQIALLLGTAAAIGAFTAPFVAGQFADRFFRSERFLGFLLLIGAGIQFTLAQVTGAQSWQVLGLELSTYHLWLGLSVLYSVVYMPTISLSNAIAFAHVQDSKYEFPRVRLWGTIGWIAAGWGFSALWLTQNVSGQWLPPFYQGEERGVQFMIDSLNASGFISLAYALLCFFALPATPPKRDAVQSLAFAEAFGLLRHRSFLVLMLVGLAVAMIHNIYFMQASKFLQQAGLADSQILPAMSVGQFSEIIVMALLGVLLVKLGFRWVMTVGVLAYLLRYAIWGTPGMPIEVLVASQFLHGFCFACFIAAAFMYVDRIAPPDIRNSAQTVFNMTIFGGGPILAGLLVSSIAPAMQVETETGTALDYTRFWYTMAAIGLVAMILFAATFRDQTQDRSPAPAPA